MFLVDVNVLLYALDGASRHHVKCLAWLEAAGDGVEPLGVSSQVLASVVRLATNPVILARPAAPKAVIAFLDDVRNLPAFIAIEPGAEHWATFSKLILAHDLQGGALTDGWLAALALETGAKLVTTDRGFVRYRGVRVVDPTRS